MELLVFYSKRISFMGNNTLDLLRKIRKTAIMIRN
jgi:hypothetical protein